MQFSRRHLMGMLAAGSEWGQTAPTWTIRWDVRLDVSDNPATGGHAEKTTPPINVSVTFAKGSEALFRLPATPGKYRIFVYALDAAGNAATANVPVMIK